MINRTAIDETENKWPIIIVISIYSICGGMNISLNEDLVVDSYQGSDEQIRWSNLSANEYRDSHQGLDIIGNNKVAFLSGLRCRQVSDKIRVCHRLASPCPRILAKNIEHL